METFRKSVLFGVMLALSTLIFTSVASATVITFNFNFPDGEQGSSHVYSAGGVALPAYGFNNLGSPMNLFGKNAGTDEIGLGVHDGVNNEISHDDFLQVDMSNLWAVHPASFGMSMNSVQSGEAWAIFGSNTLGAKGTQLMVGGSEGMQIFGTVPTGYKYISLTATSYDVLLYQMTADTSQGGVPEPATSGIVGGGLIGLYFLRHRQRR